jgi:hypothetical protein
MRSMRMTSADTKERRSGTRSELNVATLLTVLAQLRTALLSMNGRPVQDREGKKGGGERDRESCWKSGGGECVFHTWARVRLADEVGSDVMPDAAGGEGGHGAAKPHRVIHMYLVT